MDAARENVFWNVFLLECVGQLRRYCLFWKESGIFSGQICCPTVVLFCGQWVPSAIISTYLFPQCYSSILRSSYTATSIPLTIAIACAAILACAYSHMIYSGPSWSDTRPLWMFCGMCAVHRHQQCLPWVKAAVAFFWWSNLLCYWIKACNSWMWPPWTFVSYHLENWKAAKKWNYAISFPKRSQGNILMSLTAMLFLLQPMRHSPT